MSARACPTCGQPLPEQPLRDPPLPPLEFPAVVTIHDLPPDQRAKAKVEIRHGNGSDYRMLRLELDKP